MYVHQVLEDLEVDIPRASQKYPKLYEFLGVAQRSLLRAYCFHLGAADDFAARFNTVVRPSEIIFSQHMDLMRLPYEFTWLDWRNPRYHGPAPGEGRSVATKGGVLLRAHENPRAIQAVCFDYIRAKRGKRWDMAPAVWVAHLKGSPPDLRVHYLIDDLTLDELTWIDERGQWGLTMAEMFLVFLHSKNTRAVKVTPNPKLQKKRLRAEKQPFIEYRCLEITGLRRHHDGVGPKGTHASPGLHSVRGGFRDYKSPGQGKLFGRLKGIFFVPDFKRGSRKHGVIVKDYVCAEEKAPLKWQPETQPESQ